MPSCDIVIPTYNNAHSIGLVLQALYASRIPAGWDVRLLVSDDGSSDETLVIAKDIASPPNWREQLIIQGAHQGAAAARNRGIKASNAEIVFLLGGDIILKPDALDQHLDFHATNPQHSRAALGMVAWDPLIRPTPLMVWMMHGGPQNDFDVLLGKATADPRHFFTASHLSLKRSFLENDLFDEQFQGYGWEDLDLGRRLAARGLVLYLLSEALSWHHHLYTPHAIAARQYAVGKGLMVYQGNHPKEKLLPPQPKGWWWKQYVASSPVSQIVWILLSWVGARWTAPQLFLSGISIEFWRGVKEAKRLKNAKK